MRVAPMCSAAWQPAPATLIFFQQSSPPPPCDCATRNACQHGYGRGKNNVKQKSGITCLLLLLLCLQRKVQFVRNGCWCCFCFLVWRNCITWFSSCYHKTQASHLAGYALRTKRHTHTPLNQATNSTANWCTMQNWCKLIAVKSCC